MSPTVNNFVHDLVAMAKAMEDLPVVQAQAEELARQNGELAQSVQSREESILKLKAEIEALHAKVRSTEAERDDAELRFLDLDEKSAKAIRFLAQIQGMAVQAEVALVPPKPEPTPPAPTQAEYDNAQVVMGQSDYTPTKPSSTTDGGQTIGSTDSQHPFEGSGGGLSQPLPVTSFEEVPKSDANPIGATGGEGQSTPSAETVNQTENAPTPVDDVGYHNEPDVGTDWTAWNAWCERMRQRYGTGAWPQRPDNAAPSVA